MYQFNLGFLVLRTFVLLLISSVACQAESNSSQSSQKLVEVAEGAPVRVNGKPFFPIGMYHVANTAEFATLRDAGFNTVHSYGWEGRADYWEEDGEIWLDEAAKAGLMGLVSFDRRNVQNLRFDAIRNVVEKYRQHPALLAWHVMDEPAVGRIRHAPRDQGVSGDVFMPKMYEFLRELDPYHPVTAVFPQFGEVQSFIHTVDIFQTTYYPIPTVPEENYVGTGFRGFGNFASRLRHGSGVDDFEGGAVWWPVLQAYAKRGYAFPTDEELRGMTYTVIAMGARGVYFWSLVQMKAASGDGDFYESENWLNLASLVGELDALQPLLTADTEEHFISLGAVRALVKSDGTDTFVIVANVERRPTSISLAIPGFEDGWANLYFEDGDSLKIENGVGFLELGSIESRVYVLRGR